MPARRACPGCSTPIPKSTRRCATCARKYEAKRGTRIERGYDAQHVRESQAWKQRVRNGELVICWYCNKPITNADDCVLGHDPYDRSITRGPQHDHCNSVDAGRMSHALR